MKWNKKENRIRKKIIIKKKIIKKIEKDKREGA